MLCWCCVLDILGVIRTPSQENTTSMAWHDDVIEPVIARPHFFPQEEPATKVITCGASHKHEKIK
jgi:hypothetical protein